jgi:hypothetical protein
MARAMDMYKIHQMCVSPTFYCLKREKSVETVGYCKYKAFRQVPGNRKVKRTGRVILADEDLSQA